MATRGSLIIDQVRAEALRRGIPAGDVERWLGLSRPCALLTQNGEGPVVGALRGPVLLPAGAENPSYPLIVSIDCGALPADVTDLPLPSDGRLLLFGWPEGDGWGEVRYVPAGTPVEERPLYPPSFPADDKENSEVYAELSPSDLRLTVDVSLPYVGTLPGSASLPGHPRSRELAEVWQDVLRAVPDGVLAHQRFRTPLLVGGYGTDDNGLDPVQVAVRYRSEEEEETDPDDDTVALSSEADDWVLLAELHGGRPGGSTIFWMMRRDDLIARRFDRSRVLVDWNP